MQTLTYGRKKPQDLDGGAVFWDALAENVVIDDAHTHDGANAPKITSSNLLRGSVAVAAGGWTAVTGGTVKKTVTMPGAYTFGTCKIHVVNSDGNEIAATLVKLTSTTFELHAFADQAFTVYCT